MNMFYYWLVIDLAFEREKKEDILMIIMFQYSGLLIGTFAMYMTCAGWGFYSLDYVIID